MTKAHKVKRIAELLRSNFPQISVEESIGIAMRILEVLENE